jgi:hypothetical protein
VTLNLLLSSLAGQFCLFLADANVLGEFLFLLLEFLFQFNIEFQVLEEVALLLLELFQFCVFLFVDQVGVFQGVVGLELDQLFEGEFAQFDLGVGLMVVVFVGVVVVVFAAGAMDVVALFGVVGWSVGGVGLGVFVVVLLHFAVVFVALLVFMMVVMGGALLVVLGEVISNLRRLKGCFRCVS